MPIKVNPFKPTAGKNPPLLIDRREILDDFREGILDGPGAPGRLMRITGARGSGKTVLLNAFGAIAKEYGWAVIDETAGDQLCERIRSQALAHNPLTGVSLKASLPLVSADVNLTQPASTSLRAALTHRVEGLTRAGKGLLITIDEVQDAAEDDMRIIAQAVQHLIREDQSIALIFAGITSGVMRIIDGKAMTFLRRAMAEELHPIPLLEVADALRRTFEENGLAVHDSELKAMARASAGYPFMIQLIGYRVFRLARRHEAEQACVLAIDVERGVEGARAEYETMVLEVSLNQLSALPIAFLLAMAQDDSSSAISEIAKRLGKSTQGVSPVRQELISEQVIEPVSRGRIDFALPYLREYLREHEDDLRARFGLL